MLGGTPRCERCGGAVYHAEQVMGPGRKIYHKLCLKCENCGKRLDQGNLVQHDSLPYCSRCHTQLFGTRDLRHANLHAGSSPSTSPARPRVSAEENSTPAPRLAPRPVAAPHEYYTPPPELDAGGDSAAAPSSSSADTPTPLVANLPSTPGSRSVGAGFATGGPAAVAATRSTPAASPDVPEVTRVNFRAERPMPAGVSPAVASGLSQRDSPRSKVGVAPGFEDRCKGCEKRVYAAEQVFAIGHKWHRGCLRCTSCKSTIDPSRVSDRDGAPWCKNCYAREHGPQGIAGKR